MEVSIFGKAGGDAFNRLTGEICSIYEETAGIPKDKIYVRYTEAEHWGWNGSNF